MDADLTGMMLGMTPHTKPEEIYRALIEATAFGTRMIIETFRENGVPVEELYATGGIAEKIRLSCRFMQTSQIWTFNYPGLRRRRHWAPRFSERSPRDGKTGILQYC